MYGITLLSSKPNCYYVKHSKVDHLLKFIAGGYSVLNSSIHDEQTDQEEDNSQQHSEYDKAETWKHHFCNAHQML